MFEADESDGSFLLAPASIGVITNIEVDHAGLLSRAASTRSSRRSRRSRRGAEHVVAFGDDAGVHGPRSPRRGTDATTYGRRADNDLVVAIDELGPAGAARPRRRRGRRGRRSALGVDGAHNLLNAAAAIGRRARLRRGPRRRRRCARGRSPASTGGSSSAGAPAEPTSSTTTAIRRPRWRSRSTRPVAASRGA